MGKILNYLIIPGAIYLFIVLAFIGAKLFLFKDRMSWWAVIIVALVLMFLWALLAVLAGFVLPAIITGLANRQGKEMAVPYADIPEMRAYITAFFLNDKTNPVNLELGEYKQEGIVSVGKENQKTEIYLCKFKDSAALSRDIYYVAIRVEEPNKIDYITRKVQPSFEEEKKILMDIANRLAKVPDKGKVTELRIEQTPFGETKIKTIKESQSEETNVDNELGGEL